MKQLQQQVGCLGQPVPKRMHRKAGWTSSWALVPGLAFVLAAQVLAGPVQLASVPGPVSPPAGGGGDSWAPVVSPDGRYVLFASTANNLALTSSNTAFAPAYLPPLNVFLRDRASGTTTLVSVNLSGTGGGGNGDSLPVCVSTNGRFVAFESSASNLVPGDTNGVADVFVRDLALGTTVLVSVSTNGNAGNGASRSAAMTPDGRFVAFASEANNLVADDTNGMADVFVRDLQAQTTMLASVGLLSSSGSGAPDITPDGRYVAFYSTATNGYYGQPTTQGIYVRDLTAGTTICASAGAGAAALAMLNASNLLCYNHAISADGKYVAYEASPASGSSSSFPGLILRYSLDTDQTDLVHTNAAIEAMTGGLEIHNLDLTPDGQRIVFVANTNGTMGATTCILLWDAATGLCSLVSADLNNQVVTNATCDWPAIDATGRFVTFGSSATGLTTNVLTGDWHLYLRDLQAGTTLLLDADINGVGSPIGSVAMPYLSANGQVVAFECNDGPLTPNDRNRCADVIVRDLPSDTMELISAHEATLPSLTPNGTSVLAPGCVSSDGRYVAFASDADNLVTNDNNGFRDIFVRDQGNATNLLVSVNTNGFSGNGVSSECALSADGRYVAFTSQANDLVAGDSNAASDVFVRDLQTGVTTLVSVNSTATGPGNKGSYSPLIAAGGRYVMFRSKATNLAAGPFSGTDNLFVRDLQTGTTYALTTGGLTMASMTPDGRYVAYIDASGGSLGYGYVWSTASASRVFTNRTGYVTMVAISPDGSRLAYGSANQFFATDRTSGVTWTITNTPPIARASLHFSADNHFLTYTLLVNVTAQVYLYDFLGKTNLLISHSYNATGAGNDSSGSPDISADGRFIAYRSAAINLVPEDTNGQPDLFLYDRQTGTTTLLSASLFGNFSGAGCSLCPVFSADGQTLVFQTWAADLVDADFNQAGDVVSYSLYTAGAIPVFSARISASTQGLFLTWPVQPGKSYHVQFKNNLSEPDWQELGGNVTIVGSQGSCQDLAPSATQRFYRIAGN